MAGLLDHLGVIRRDIDDVHIFEGEAMLAHDGADAVAPAAAGFEVGLNRKHPSNLRAFRPESSATAFGTLFVGLRLIPVADAVNRPEAFEAAPKLLEGLADLRNILVQGAAPYVRVDAPDCMDEAIAADDHAGIGVQVIKNTDLLPPEFTALAWTKDQLQSLGVNFGAVKVKDVRREVGVARETAIARGFAAPEHRMDAGRQFFGVVRLTDEVIGARLERLDDGAWRLDARQENHRCGGAGLADTFQDREPIEVGQGGVEQHQVHVVFFDELKGGGPLVECLRREPGIGELLVQGRG